MAIKVVKENKNYVYAKITSSKNKKGILLKIPKDKRKTSIATDLKTGESMKSRTRNYKKPRKKKFTLF